MNNVDKILDSLNENKINESKWNVDGSSPVAKVKKEAQRLVNKAKSSNNPSDAWDVVDFLYDFPNALK